MFIGCRIIAEGSRLVAVNSVAIRKGVRVPGEQVDTYASRPKQGPWVFRERKIPLMQTGRLVADAVAPSVLAAARGGVFEKIFRQILLFTYPFWLVEYRRVQSWAYAFGICRGMRPRNILAGVEVGPVRRLRLRVCYLLSSVFGLMVPIALFDRAYPALYAFVKSVYSNRARGK